MRQELRACASSFYISLVSYAQAENTKMCYNRFNFKYLPQSSLNKKQIVVYAPPGQKLRSLKCTTIFFLFKHMASPQTENGYTRISNELLEAVYEFTYPSASPLKITLFILRKTYGFGKKTDVLSLSQIVKGVKLSRPTVVHWLDWLVKSLLLVKGKITKKGVVYGINKDYSQWLVKPLKLVKRSVKTSKTPLTHKRNNKRNNTLVKTNETNNSKHMYEEPTIHLDEEGEEIEVPEPHSGSFGKYTRQVAEHFVAKHNKIVTGQTMSASKKLLAFIHKEYPDDDNASLAKEAKMAIDLTGKFYSDKGVEEWGLVKVIENWKNI